MSTPVKLWTASAAAAADRHTMDALGMPSPVLMERAALCVSAEVEGLADARGLASILVLVGPGNNGGDGLAIARQLHGRGRRVTAALVCPRHAAAVAQQLQLARSHGVEVVEGLLSRSRWGQLGAGTLVVDALLGTGSRGAPRGAVKEALEWLAGREIGAVVAVDLPSGVDVDSGVVEGLVVRADLTVTFQRSKFGLHCTPARAWVGELVIADIGLVADPREAPSEAELISPAWVRAQLEGLPVAAHKGRRGHVGVIGGTGGTPGAAILAATAALRSGAGLATLAPVTSQLRRALIELRPELMLASEADAWSIPEASVLVVGPGLVEADEEAIGRLRRLDPRPMIWDASGLDGYEAEAAAGPRILTPHPGEAARMLARFDAEGGWTSAKVQSQRRAAVERLAALTGAIVVLKGEGSLVCEAAAGQGRLAVCTTGGPALATAGSGDVLAGAIAGLLARGLDPWAAACVGVYVHGLAGDRLDEAALAMDVADALGPGLAAARAGEDPLRWPRWVRG